MSFSLVFVVGRSCSPVLVSLMSLSRAATEISPFNYCGCGCAYIIFYGILRRSNLALDPDRGPVTCICSVHVEVPKLITDSTQKTM